MLFCFALLSPLVGRFVFTSSFHRVAYAVDGVGSCAGCAVCYSCLAAGLAEALLGVGG